VKALFGEMQTKGRLPVSLPGIGERGFGLELKANELQVASTAQNSTSGVTK
jgi:hypothetical protein